MAKRAPPWQPGPEDFKRVLGEQNPWHLHAKVPDALALSSERPLARLLWERLRTNRPRRFQLILGPRRVGKTTAMYQTVRHLLQEGIAPSRLWWFRLDHPILLESSLEQLVRLALQSTTATEEEPLYLFLDELTYARDWDLWLKTFFDERWPIQIAGTSSSTAALRERHTESGVGRWEEQYLAPYLFDEFLELIGHAPSLAVEATLAKTLQKLVDEPIGEVGLIPLRQKFTLIGGFPELLLGARLDPVDDESNLLNSQRVLRSDAVERAIYKDIPQAFGVNDPLMLERMLYTLAGQMTGLLSPSSLCKGLGISQPTFDRYLSYLERAFMVFPLPNYTGNESSTQRRGRKLYFVDGAIRNAALQRGIAPLSDPAEMGLLIENLAASHLFALSQQSQVRLYHWRDRGDEVDLVYDDPSGPLAFEIGASSTHSRKGLETFVRQHPRFRGGAWYVAPGLSIRRPSGEVAGTLPLELFLLATGSQAVQGLRRRIG